MPDRRGSPRTAVTGLALAAVLLALPGPAGLGGPDPALAAAPCPSGHIALTFDDGPSPTTTPPILDLLARRDAPATFFVVGGRVDARPDLARRAAADGHAVANHTYWHERLTTLSDGDILRTVTRTDRAVRDAGVAPLRLVRPPYGATSTRVRSVLAEGGFGHVLWSVDPRDWERTSTSIRAHVLANLRDGAIVLLHDGSSNSGQTAAALPAIIDGARQQGYCLTTLDDAGRLVREIEVDWREHGGPFRDVPPTSTHAPAITTLRDLGVVLGCDTERYCPNEAVTRAQMASLLQRAFGLGAGPTDLFRDVGAGNTHAEAIGAVAEAGITLGCSEDGRSFCPTDPIPRDQMASFLQRTLGLPDGVEDRFADVVPGSTHAAAIGAVAEADITRGCGGDGRLYCPDARVTRAQMASFVVRALERAGD
jgi:peptidoglycan/xylan/chitin deacetylase (PgdA/CDA1 family)